MKKEVKKVLDTIDTEFSINEAISYLNIKLKELNLKDKITKDLFLKKLRLTEETYENIERILLTVDCCLCIGGFRMNIVIYMKKGTNSRKRNYYFESRFKKLYDNFCKVYDARTVYNDAYCDEIKTALFDSNFLRELETKGIDFTVKIDSNYDT